MNEEKEVIDWFASDHHVGHKKIIELTGRPFASVEEMDAALVFKHNSVVRQWDRVWFVGDFSFYNADETGFLLRQMNGQKILIKGNHDHGKRIKDAGFQDVLLAKDLTIDGDHIVLCHFPMLVWNLSHRGSYMLHGHSHGGLAYPAELACQRIFDVGVDNLYKVFGSFKPVNWKQLKTHLADRTHVALDHHREKEAK